MRITIDEQTYNKIVDFFKDDADVLEELIEAKKKYDESITDNKIIAVTKARITKEVDAQKKVMNAINLAKLQGLKITPGVIAKIAEVHYYTARKYLEMQS